MTDYKFDRTLDIPATEFTEAHIPLQDACARACDLYSRLDKAHSVRWENISDSEIRVYGNGEHATTVYFLLSRITHELFTSGTSPSADGMMQTYLALRDAGDENSLKGNPDKNTAITPTFEAKAKDKPIQRTTDVTFSSLGYTGRQNRNYHSLQGFLSDHCIGFAELNAKKVRLSSTEDSLLAIGKRLVEWASDVIPRGDVTNAMMLREFTAIREQVEGTRSVQPAPVIDKPEARYA